MPPGRINIGVPFYTRGWQNVSGGNNGLWGEAPLPPGMPHPPGTGDNVGSTVPPGYGAQGIDNIWCDLDKDGNEIFAGVNPMWHAKNLENGILGSYLPMMGFDPAAGVENQLVGTYNRYYDEVAVAPWLWNETKKVFLSTEDEQSIAAKAQYVITGESAELCAGSSLATTLFIRSGASTISEIRWLPPCMRSLKTLLLITQS